MRGFFYNQKDMGKIHRIDFIDIGKCVAMLFIILIHVLQRTYPGFVSTWGATYMLVLGVTPFFFLSGMSYSYKRPLTPLGFVYDIFKRAFAYFLPFIWFLLFRVLLYGQWVGFPTAFSEILEYPVSGLWVCWILVWTVLFVDIGLFIAHWIPRAKVICVALSLAIAFCILIALRKSEVIPSDHFLGYDYFIIYVPVFLVGYLAGKYVFSVNKKPIGVICLLIGLGGLIPVAMFNTNIITVTFLQSKWMFYLGCLCAIIAFYGFITLVRDLSWSRVLAFGGRYTMEAYFLHLMIIKNWSYAELPNGWAIFGMSVGLYVLCIVNTVVITLVTYWVPFLHFALFGRHYSHYAFENALFEKLKRACIAK